jgi:hypothetical protein
MKKNLHRFHVLSISLGTVAAIGFLYNLVILSILCPKVERFDPISAQWEIAGIVVGISLFLIALFHLAGVLALLLNMIARRSVSWWRASLLFLGILSGIMILSDLAMLQDIGKQYAQGWNSTGEWIILFTSSGLHGLFIGLTLPALITNLRIPGSDAEEPALKDHVMFQLLHITGLLCGLLGVGMTIAAVAFQVPLWILEQTAITVSSLILAPFVLILLIWFWFRRRESPGEWFDEKQLQDLGKAALGSLLISTPIMILLYWLQRAFPEPGLWPHIWLPTYLFCTLLVFSSTTLLQSRS